MNPKRGLVSTLAALLLASACSDKQTSSNPGVATPDATTIVTTDAWLGQWNGPEGTFIRLTGGKGQYQITIQNLDGPRSFAGHHTDGAIRFERNGLVETIRHSSGEQTGMKWLVDKKDCLTVNLGEGYCRD